MPDPTTRPLNTAVPTVPMESGEATQTHEEGVNPSGGSFVPQLAGV